MEELLRFIINNPGTHITIGLIIWIIIQVHKLETKIAVIQNDINYLRKQIYTQRCENNERNNS